MSGAEFIAATLPQAHLQDASLMEQLYCDVFGLQDSASGATLVDDTKLLRALAGPAGIQVCVESDAFAVKAKLAHAHEQLSCATCPAAAC